MAMRAFRHLLESLQNRRRTIRRRSQRQAFQKQLGRQRAHETLEGRVLLSGSPFEGIAHSLPLPVLRDSEILLLATGPSPNNFLDRQTHNVNAADTTNADQLQAGGVLALGLTGAGLTVGVWDGGPVLATHQEFGGRVVSGDGAAGAVDHATHVAGTIGAAGVNPAAEGMATGVDIRSYDWNNDSGEMARDAALLVASNHSYGLVAGWNVYPAGALGLATPSGLVDVWLEDRFVYTTEDTGFGKYDQTARDLDQVLFSNPHLLSVWSSGNDRNDAFTNINGDNQYAAWFSGNPGGIGYAGAGWYLAPNAGATLAPGGDGDGGTGYDSLSPTQNAKNSLVVGSVGDVTADPYTSTMIVTAAYSSYGPTDDGRIKPDVVGNGESLLSSLATGNAAYGGMSGTSMAAPNVTGTVTLLTELYRDTFGSLPSAATSKGLVIHTAADAGNPGPDYAHGWGLVNAADAATFISRAAAGGSGDSLIQDTFSGGESVYTFVSTGRESFKATLVWTDLPGAVQPAGLDIRTPVLVHDLDLVITNQSGRSYYPWTLNPNNPSAPAIRTQRNLVDNVEQVLIDAPAAGIYTVRVSASSAVSTQAFSLLVSGTGGGVTPTPPERQIPAPGPQLIAARSNEGELLLPQTANAALDVAPRELQLLFRGGAGIDGSTTNLAQGIRITRQGSDGAFDYAYAKTDFNTAGAVVVTFDAMRLGQAEEGITIQFTKSDHGTGDRRPMIQVLGKAISIDLNSQVGAETTARVLVDALNSHPSASARIQASVTGNTALPLTTNLARAASVATDFNTVTSPLTGGTAELEFTAVTAGTAGNAIQIVVTKSDHANQSMAPTIAVTGTTISIDLNDEVGYHTRAQQVADAINQHPVARTLVRARVKSGSLLADVAAPEINYSPLLLSGGDNGNGFVVPLAPLVLSGAGRAEATASFGVPGLEVLVRAASPGLAGDGIQVTVLAANLGLNTAPTVTVRENKITVTLNTNATTPRRTALDLINAINNTPAAAALVTASVLLGNPASVISAAAPTTLETGGADEIIVPGYLGLGETSSELIVRFAETLPDDVYRLEVFAKDYVNLDIQALRNTAGTPLTPLHAGDDRDTIDFTLNLAPQIISVVPQPVTRRIQVRLTSVPGDGDFQLIFQGERTQNLPVSSVTAQTIQNALEALPSIEPGEVLVSGPNLGPWEISFLGRYVNLPLADLRSDEAVVDVRYVSKLTQAEDQVLVYFNDDDLLPSSAENREFYRLIATGGTGTVADDLILVPHSVRYDADRDLAVLRFDDDGDLSTPYRLPHGTYRLEVGESEEPNNTLAAATVVGTRFGGVAYQKVATLEGADTDFYRIDLPDASDLHVTVTPDAEVTARGNLDARVLVMDSSGAPLQYSNEVQRLSYGGLPAVGTTFTLSYGVFPPTTTSPPLPYDATATDIQLALEALGDIYPGDVLVTGGPLNVAPIDIEFTGGLAGASVDKLLITDSTNGRLGVQKTDRLSLTGAAAGTYFVEVSSVSGAGSYLVEINSSAVLTVNDANTSFATATALGVLGEGGHVVFSQIEPQNIALPQYPGSDDEPGHRQIQAEQHINFLPPGGYDFGIDPVAPGAITIRPYNFQNVIGEFPAGSGNLLFNLITEEEKQLAREAFEILGSLLGIQFVETPNLGTTIAKGDLRAADPTVTNGPGGVAGLGGPLLVVIDASEGWTSSKFGGDFFETLFHEIGHSIGLGHSYDLPSLMGAGLPNDVYPGDVDLVNAQRLWRPDANDIDLYRFEVTSSGLFQAETVAERATTYSFLNTVLTLFSRDGEILSRNDDYFGNDSFLELDLTPGVYYIGVTSRGNIDYDPSVPDSGFGGLTDGAYELKLGFMADERTALLDATGVKLDGDHDGRPGGVFEFWFQTSDDVIFVDKARDTLPAAPEGTGTATDPYDSIATALADAGARIVTPARGSSVIRDGDSFVVHIGATPRTFEFDVFGNGVTAGRTAVPVPTTEIQRVSFTGVATSGTFTLSFGALAPTTTVGLPHNASSADVQTALESLGDIRAGEIRVTGGPLNVAPIHVEFTGRFAGTHPTLMVAKDNTNGGSGAGLRVTQTQSLAVSIRDAINSLVPPASPIATLTPSATAIRLTSVPRVDVSGTPGLLTGSNVVRVAGNAGTDNDVDTVGDNRAYLIGTSNTNAVLPDGNGLIVPQGVTLMIDEGALLKFRKANIDVGTSAVAVNRAAGAVQVLGTPDQPVLFRSYRDDTAGGNTDPTDVAAAPGDWGGIVLRNDSDFESQGIFLNWINHADLAHGGGKVHVGSVESSFAPLHLIDARPTIGFNTISRAVGAAISANPGSFEETPDRIGPDVFGNHVSGNTLNGMFVRTETALGQPLARLAIQARFDDADIVHVITENLQIVGNAGGPLMTAGGTLQARLGGRLAVDPGVVVKFNQSRIELERGSANLIAEGRPGYPIILTSIADDRYGVGGTFDTNNDDRLGVNELRPAAGNWGGLVFNHVSRGSLDQVLVAYAGGQTPLDGTYVPFNPIEIHQADVRLANSLLEYNASGAATGTRSGRGANEAAAIYVRGAQPVIVNNVLRNNLGAAISINANSLAAPLQADVGRSTGEWQAFEAYGDNRGPLIRGNRLGNNSINGVVIRAEELTTQSIWDDTDIVHVVLGEITVNNHHTYSGLRLTSSSTESLVVKLEGDDAGFTADGIPLEIEDRIGGTIQILGTVGHPVVLTALADDSVGAGFDPRGYPQMDTNNNGSGGAGVCCRPVLRWTTAR
jgi:hypothetical protein